MGLSEITVDGTLKSDGTLELDQKPELAPGRVTVVLRQTAETKTTRPWDSEFFQMMEEIWAGQKARGHVPPSAAEIEAQRRQMRQEWEGEVDAAAGLQEESRRLRRQAESGKEAP